MIKFCNLSFLLALMFASYKQNWNKTSKKTQISGHYQDFHHLSNVLNENKETSFYRSKNIKFCLLKAFTIVSNRQWLT